MRRMPSSCFCFLSLRLPLAFIYFTSPAQEKTSNRFDMTPATMRSLQLRHVLFSLLLQTPIHGTTWICVSNHRTNICPRQSAPPPPPS